MTEYPKYIIDEAERLINLAREIPKNTALNPIHFDIHYETHRVIADLLIESGFKPPVDPLLKEVWEAAYCIDVEHCGFAGGFDEFCNELAKTGLTVTVTKTGDA